MTDPLGQDQEDYLDSPGGPLDPGDEEQDEGARADWLYETFADLDT